MLKEKICIKCDQIKSLNEFDFAYSSALKSGFSSIIECNIDSKQNRRITNNIYKTLATKIVEI